jgi:hypothetical protein
MDYIMSLVLQSSGGGQITIQEPTTASNFTQTLPAATGTVMVSGNMPAFAVYQGGSGQSISENTWTKVVYTNKTFDTNSYFDNVTNQRFQPLVAGYYQLNTTVLSGNTSGVSCVLGIYKNGSLYNQTSKSSTAFNTGANLSVLLYLNGSTDYVETWCYYTSSTTLGSDGTTTIFNGSMVRGA